MVRFAPETGQSQFSGQKIKRTGLKVCFKKTQRLFRAHKSRWGNPGAAVRREPSKMESCRSLFVSDILL